MNGRYWQFVARLLTASACLGLLTTPCLAQEVKGLQAEAPQVDSQATPETPQSAKDESTTLHGGVNKSGYARGVQQSASADAVSSAYDAVVKKLAEGQKLTAEDYRSLHIGVYGYELFRPYFQPEARVEKVFSGCPAAQAGIQVGDVQLVEGSADDAKIVDTSRPNWWFTCGTEGQSTDVTIKRKGELLHFHLVRMNIEDIPDPKLRRTYEEMVQLTGGNGGIVPAPTMPVPASAILRALMGF